jgi:hypothetical protein
LSKANPGTKAGKANMQIRHLLKSQANEVFNALRTNGWNPADFEWQDTQGHASGQTTISKLVHKSSGYYFTFDNGGGNVYSNFTPGDERESGATDFGQFIGQLAGLVKWLSFVKREMEAPDLWGAISQESNLIDSATSDTDNTPFTADEKTYILSGLNEIKQHLLTAHKLDPELVEGRINYLIESSERLGRKDWKNLLLATLVSIIVAAALPSDAVRELFRFVGTVLRQILNSPLVLHP